MDTAGDAFWPQVRGPEILWRRGYSRATVRAAQRFFNGQLLPGEVLSVVMRFLRAYFYHFGIKGVAEGLVAATRMKMRPEAHVFGFGTLLPGWSVMDRLQEIPVPTLVLAGREDFLFPPEHQAILADRLPNARLEIVERAGHNPQDERTRVVMELITRFLLTTQPAEPALASFGSER
jgi:proline iminopeptidase